jgi:hypothetical protein
VSVGKAVGTFPAIPRSDGIQKRFKIPEMGALPVQHASSVPFVITLIPTHTSYTGRVMRLHPSVHTILTVSDNPKILDAVVITHPIDVIDVQVTGVLPVVRKDEARREVISAVNFDYPIADILDPTSHLASVPPIPHLPSAQIGEFNQRSSPPVQNAIAIFK